MYLTEAWRENGWQLWDNFWYAGRYAQVNYSLLFYPLAALLGTPTVVVGSCAGAAAAFSALLRRRWPAISTGPAVAFALLVPLAVAAGTFPFLLGLAVALGSLVALAAGRRGLALAGVLITAAAHPLALAFLLAVLLAAALTTPGWWRSRANLVLAAGTVAVAGVQALLLAGSPRPTPATRSIPRTPSRSRASAPRACCSRAACPTSDPCGRSSWSTRASARWRSRCRRRSAATSCACCC